VPIVVAMLDGAKLGVELGDSATVLGEPEPLEPEPLEPDEPEPEEPEPGVIRIDFVIRVMVGCRHLICTRSIMR
jgi:hypothetical protein